MTRGRVARLSPVLVAGVVAVTVLLALPSQDLVVVPAPPPTGLATDRLPIAAIFRSHIDHIIVVMLENHAYDNYFGTYCLVTGRYCSTIADGLPPNLCVPRNPNNTAAGCTRPWSFTPANWSLSSPLPHGFPAANGDYQNGSMDGWYATERSGRDPFGHYNGTTAPLFWDIAEEYGLGDQFYSTTLAYSLPNHWRLVAGAAPNITIDHIFGSTILPIRRGNDSQYLGEANRTRTVEDLLLNSSVSWRYYDHALVNYSTAIRDTPSSLGEAYGLFDPEAAKAESYNASFRPHFENNSIFFRDARRGTLPQLAWLMPTWAESDHPPSNVTNAEAFVASVLDAVGASSAWNSTALFITWDDFGGFYDHIPPRPLNGTGTLNLTGFRVPLLVVGPYARVNYVSHGFGYFESLLHLMEWRFNLGCLTAADCHAPLPFQYFDFNQTPRPPILWSTNYRNWTYPLALQAPGAPFPQPVGPYLPPAEFVDFSGPGASEEVD